MHILLHNIEQRALLVKREVSQIAPHARPIKQVQDLADVIVELVRYVDELREYTVREVKNADPNVCHCDSDFTDGTAFCQNCGKKARH